MFGTAQGPSPTRMRSLHVGATLVVVRPYDVCRGGAPVPARAMFVGATLVAARFYRF